MKNLLTPAEDHAEAYAYARSLGYAQGVLVAGLALLVAAWVVWPGEAPRLRVLCPVGGGGGGIELDPLDGVKQGESGRAAQLN